MPKKDYSYEAAREQKVRVKVKGGKNAKTMEVEGQPLYHDGKIHHPGEEFVTTAYEAAALTHCEILGPVEEPEPVGPKEETK